MESKTTDSSFLATRSMEDFRVEQFQSEIRDIEKENIALRGKIKEQQEYCAPPSIMLTVFPDSKLLPNYSSLESAEAIRGQLEGLFGRIASTELLYSYDHLNILHYQKYICDRTNLVVLVKL